MSISAGLNGTLDSCVLTAHRIRFFKRKYHPYFLMSDLAVLAGLAFTWFYIRRMGGLNFIGFISIFLLVKLLYRFALKAKERFFGARSRSLLQDTVFFLLPLYALLIYLFGYSFKSAFDLSGLFLPLYFFFARLGCFTGGCCYGVPSSVGVLYPDYIFRSERGCRSFSPGENPGRRVFPVQLLEAFVHLALFFGLAYRLEQRGAPDGLTLPLYLLFYSCTRFFLDFIRKSSARPRIGRFSEAQIVSVVLAGTCLLVLVFARSVRHG